MSTFFDSCVTPPPDPDARFTLDLYTEVSAVLERHGYRQPADPDARNLAYVYAVDALRQLVRVFEGREAR